MSSFHIISPATSYFSLLQLTPVQFGDLVVDWQIEYVCTHSSERHSLKRLGKEICQHNFGGAICHFNFSMLDLICYKKLMDI